MIIATALVAFSLGVVFGIYLPKGTHWAIWALGVTIFVVGIAVGGGMAMSNGKTHVLLAFPGLMIAAAAAGGLQAWSFGMFIGRAFSRSGRP